jgi:hypothetical protein
MMEIRIAPVVVVVVAVCSCSSSSSRDINDVEYTVQERDKTQ